MGTYPAADGKHSLDVCSPLKETYPGSSANIHWMFAPLSRWEGDSLFSVVSNAFGTGKEKIFCVFEKYAYLCNR